MDVGIIVGHNEIEQGSFSFDAMTEYTYNLALAKDISKILQDKVEYCEIIKKLRSDASRIVNESPADFFIELHCNAFDLNTKGTETLYTANNKNSSVLAHIMQRSMVLSYDRIAKQDRGSKLLVNGDRGYNNLINITKPACIIEPFFIDCKYDYETYGKQKRDKLIFAIINACEQFDSFLKTKEEK